MDTYDKEAAKKYYQKYRPQVLQSVKRRYEQDRVQILSGHKVRRADNYLRYALYSCKARAKKKKILFDLRLKDLGEMPAVCRYLGTPLIVPIGRGEWSTTPSIDRINSSKGYVKGNVQIISFLANVMKNSATEQELITFAKNILKLHK